ncbi:MAG: 1,3-propanediol dehydrogenase [Syntrophaceae bacterium PtaU1.Bin231]|nr:MAG: 1,3-propanediol dehydrogenase [Syntrophaceae bacterium PtaU1.Bin231]
MDTFFKMSDVFMFQLPRKVIFGNGAVKKMGEEALALCGNGKKVLLISDKGVVGAGLTADAKASLEKSGFEVVLFDRVTADAPISLVHACTELGRKEKVGAVIAIGGGSVIDTAKAVSFMIPYEGKLEDNLGIGKVKKPGLPKIFVPTTAGTGSELSHTFVLYDDESGDKITSYSPYCFADISLIDPVLTLNLPPKITAESGMDAFSHALESFVTIRANPLSDVLSLKGIEVISRNIQKAYAKGNQNLEARYAMCFGVCMGTMAIRSSGVGAIHATCYPPAMEYHLSHGVAISIMMPYVMEYNLIANMTKYAAVAEAMGEKVEGLSQREAAQASVEAVRGLMRDLSLPMRLRDVGGKKEDSAKFAATVVKRYAHHIANNPRNLTEKDLVNIYEMAW